METLADLCFEVLKTPNPGSNRVKRSPSNSNFPNRGKEESQRIDKFHWEKFHYEGDGIKLSQRSQIYKTVSKKYLKVLKTHIVTKIYSQFME